MKLKTKKIIYFPILFIRYWFVNCNFMSELYIGEHITLKLIWKKYWQADAGYLLF